MAKSSKRSTRERIIDTSRELFTEQNISRITTNHIAREMGISPGNLYYHYGSKDEILIEMGHRMLSGIQEARDIRGGTSLTLEGVLSTFFKTAKIHWQYRFFFREFAALARMNPELKIIYDSLSTSWEKDMNTLVRSFEKAGYMHLPKHINSDALVHSARLLHDYYFTDIELLNQQVTDKDIFEAVLRVFDMLLPYFTEEARKKFERTVIKVTKTLSQAAN